MPGENLGASFSIDITDLKAGLSQANRLIKESESEFRAASAGLDDWTKSEEGLTAKIKSLNQITDIQQKKVNALQEQYDKLIAEGLDPTSKEAVELQTRINNETAALKRNQKQTGELEETLVELREGAKKAGKSVDEFAESLDNADEKADEAGDGFTVLKGAVATFAGNAMTALVGSVKNGASALFSLTEETKEYRTELAKIETTASQAGASTDLIKKKWHDLGAVLGDEGAVAEGLNNLVTAGFTTEAAMDEITQNLEGASIKWKDTLKFEGLADGLQETLATGAAVGPFAELLERAGVNLEEFDEGLSKCKDSAEQQNYVLNQLSKLGLKDVSVAYREQNADLIASNKATTEYTDTMAELGEAMQPVNTEIASLKTELVKEFAPALKKDIIPGIQKFIKACKEKDVIGKLSDTIEWAADNAGTLALMAGSAVVAIKGFSIVSGVTKAIKLVTGAQAAWNLAMSANPIGAVVTACALLVGGIAALTLAIKNNETAADKRKKKAEKTLELVREEAKAYKELKAAQEEQAAADLVGIENASRLNKELQGLVDESGRVKEADKARAEFILSELNKALGTEYSMTGDVISNYKDLQTEIAKTIEAKKAQILLEAQTPIYEEALTKRTKLEMEQAKQAQELAKQRQEYAKKQSEVDTYELTMSAKKRNASVLEQYQMEVKMSKLQAAAEKEKGTLETLETAYNENEETLRGYYSDINTYEQASTLILEGETGKAVNILSQKNSAIIKAADIAHKSATEQKKILEQQVIDTEINARLMKEKYEQGVEGVTKEMVETAREQADTAKQEFENVGGNITKGIADGSTKEEWRLSDAMESLVTKGLNAAKKALGIASPSRVARKIIGRMIPAGVALGVDDGTGGVVKSVKKQVNAIRSAYTSGIGDDFAAVKTNFVSARTNYQTNAGRANNAVATSSTGVPVVVNQYNTYSQAHSRYEIRKSEKNTAAAVKLAMMGV